MSKEWFYQLMGSEFGPINSAELRHKATRGEIVPDTPIRMGGSTRWVDASQIKGLFDAAAPRSDSLSSPPPSSATIKAATTTTTTQSDSRSASAIAENITNLPTTSVKVEESTTDDLLEAHAPNEDYEFFKFVGFRQALTETLFAEVDAVRLRNGWTMTQITRRALAEYIGKPELGEDKPPEPTAAQDVETQPVSTDSDSAATAHA